MIGIIIGIILIGVAMYFVNAYVPMAAPLKQLLNIVVVIIVILWLLSAFGVYHVHIPR